MLAADESVNAELFIKVWDEVTFRSHVYRESLMTSWDKPRKTCFNMFLKPAITTFFYCEYAFVNKEIQNCAIHCWPTCEGST